MAPSLGEKPAEASAGENPLAIWGAELCLIGAIAAAASFSVRPGVILGVCAALVAASGLLAAASSDWRLTAKAIFALALSFAAVVPGFFFAADLLMRTVQIAGVCYERPWGRASFPFVVLGPLLILTSSFVSPWHLRSHSLLVLRVLHAIVWFIGAGNMMLCAMTV